MLGLDKESLLFPKLVFIKDGELKQEEENFLMGQSPVRPVTPDDKEVVGKKPPKYRVRPIKLYRLDWTSVEKIKERNQWDRISWLVKNGDVEDKPYPALPSLPASYREKMDQLVFAIPASYMDAINHCCRMASQEWEHKYPFDSIIRQGCYEPAAAFVKVAFHLLADCIYDPHKQYYNRDWAANMVFKQTGLVRFWMHVVGSWVAMQNAGIEIDHGGGRPKNLFAKLPTAAPEMDAMILDMADFYMYIENSIVRAKMPATPGLIKSVPVPKNVKIRASRKSK
jgi:hypothetical protein